MKKMLLASAFALFGTFAMANENKDFEILQIFKGGAITVTTYIRNCDGEIISKTTTTTYCDNCDGSYNYATNVVHCPEKDRSAPEGQI